MGPPPAVIIIARHGARLDAADAQWHLTSPTPYDPPLTYGGWIQARALGARIAGLLRVRETSYAPAGGDASGSHTGSTDGAGHQLPRARRRKHKVIIHSSPFLRCIETSIAISAGMAQFHGLNSNESVKAAPKPFAMHSGSPQVHPKEAVNSPNLSAIWDEDEDGDKEPSQHPSGKTNPVPKSISKSQLRLDAFLGEWLSPDYYESITPPPSSMMMVASAKADLLRRATLLESSDDLKTGSNQGHFPGGWGSSWTGFNGAPAADEEPLSTMSSLGQALLHRDRSSSYSSVGSSPKKGPRRETHSGNPATASEGGYTPPVPKYALSPSEPIPIGYVAHARDACVNVDYQWDSMRPPQDWGSGGEYGEEWSAMHKRFRKGLQQMVAWYRTQDASGPTGKDDENTDTVLILVTHGAGCNALIGALTNQPVLLDVGMASLTMAMRKETANVSGSNPAFPNTARRSSVDIGLSSDYDVRLTASTEHLRVGSNPLAISSLQPHPRISSPKTQGYRTRFGSTSSSTESPVEGGFALPGPVSRFPLQRSSSTATSRSGSGLWSKSTESVDSTENHSPHPNPSTGPTSNGQMSPLITNGAVSDYQKSVDTSAPDAVQDGNNPPLLNVLTGRSNSQRGLWGAPDSVVASERERGSKRRWTVAEPR